jgi:hypothetical protein
LKNCFYTGGEVLLSEEQMKIIGHWVKIISKTSSHKNDYGVVTGVTKNKEWLKVRLSDSTIRVAFSSVLQIN